MPKPNKQVSWFPVSNKPLLKSTCSVHVLLYYRNDFDWFATVRQQADRPLQEPEFVLGAQGRSQELEMGGAKL